MNINKDWKIEADDLNVILYRQQYDKEGQSSNWVAEGYYSNVNNALTACVDKQIQGTGLKDFKAVVAKIEELHGVIAHLNIHVEPREKQKRGNIPVSKGVEGYAL